MSQTAGCCLGQIEPLLFFERYVSGSGNCYVEAFDRFFITLKRNDGTTQPARTGSGLKRILTSSDQIKIHAGCLVEN